MFCDIINRSHADDSAFGGLALRLVGSVWWLEFTLGYGCGDFIFQTYQKNIGVRNYSN